MSEFINLKQLYNYLECEEDTNDIEETEELLKCYEELCNQSRYFHIASEVMKTEDGIKVRYWGYMIHADNSSDNFMYDIDADFWQQLHYEYDGDERLTDEACIKYAMHSRGFYNFEIIYKEEEIL